MIRDLADLLQQECKPESLTRLLWAFEERPFPLGPRRLLELAEHPDEAVSVSAQRVLADFSGPEVRALALRLLDAPIPREGVALLERNFNEGDFTRIGAVVARLTVPDAVHHVDFAIHDVIRAHPWPEAVPVILALYERQPCTMCRRDEIELLAKLGPLPPWLLEECRYDASEPVREVAGQSAFPDGRRLT